MKQLYSLGSLSFLLKRQQPEVTTGDISEAANRLTLNKKTVETYLDGGGYDIIVATDLISFFQKQIQARS